MVTAYRKRIPLMVLVALLIAGLQACSTAPNMSSLNMMAMDRLPKELQSAPTAVRTAYQFAAANPELMQAVPCYCGCGRVGHTSNYDCYVAQVDANGVIQFDGHALGCSICVDITTDAMRLSAQGKSAAEIRAYVDSAYSSYGTSNMQ